MNRLEVINELKLIYKNYRFSFDGYNNLCMNEQPMNIGLLLEDLCGNNKMKLANKITELLMRLEANNE